MPRRIFLAALVAGAAALGVYWWLTATPIMLAVTAPAYTPNLANGLTAFNAGGCSSCHAVPRPARSLDARRRARDTVAVRDLLRAEYLARSGRWHRAMDRGRFRERGYPGNFSNRISLLSGLFPITSYRHAKVEDVRDLVCVSENA